MQVNKRITVTICVLGVATLILYGAVVIPSASAIRSSEGEIGAEHAKIERRYLLRNVMRKSLTALDDTKKHLRTLAGVGIHEGEELKFINALESAATNAGIEQELQLVTVNQKDLSKWEREIPLRLSLTGDYLAVLRYLRTIEHLPYYVLIDNINVRLGSGAALAPGIIGSPIVRTEISGTVYWLGESAPDFIQQANDGQ